MKVLMIDNFDSFTYNLVDEFRKRGCSVTIYRNNTDMGTIDEVIKKEGVDLILISPGPSTPAKAGNCIKIIKKYSGKLPIFGVCLGLQCIVESFGGKVDKAPEVCHGKPSKVRHDGKTIFKGLENPLQAGRYHSLCGIKIPTSLEVSARTGQVVMGVRHRKFCVEGVQFHPESILTPMGGLIIKNIIKMVGGKK